MNLSWWTEVIPHKEIQIWLSKHLPASFTTMFHNQEQFCPRGHLATPRDAFHDGGGCCGYLTGRDQRCCQSLFRAQDTLPPTLQAWELTIPEQNYCENERPPGQMHTRTLIKHKVLWLEGVRCIQAVLLRWAQSFSWTPGNSILPTQNTEAGHLAFFCFKWFFIFISVYIYLWILLQWGRKYFIKACTSSYFEMKFAFRIRLPNPMIYPARALVNTIHDKVFDW